MPNYLPTALAKEQELLRSDNTWSNIGNSMLGQSVVNPQADTGKNLVAALLQGLIGGGMSGIGEGQAEQRYTDLVNKNFTMNPESKEMDLVRGIGEMQQEGGPSSRLAAAFLQDKSARQKALIDSAAMKGQTFGFDEAGNPDEINYLANPQDEAEIAAMQKDLKSMESLMPAPDYEDMKNTIGTMRNPYEARQWIKNKHQQNQARLRMLDLDNAEPVPPDVRKATDMATTINSRLSPLFKIAEKLKAEGDQWKGKEWTWDQVKKLIPASERSNLEKWLKTGAMEAAIRQHGGGRQLSENEGKIMIDFVAGSGGMVTGDLIKRLQYLQDGVWHKGISALANAMSEGKYKVNAIRRANSIYKQMDSASRDTYKDLLFMNFYGAESTAFPKPDYDPGTVKAGDLSGALTGEPEMEDMTSYSEEELKKIAAGG